jgi:transposase
MAVGHSILVIAWHLLTDGCDYADLGGDYFVHRDPDRARQRGVAQLQTLGYEVTSNPSPPDGDSPSG